MCCLNACRWGNRTCSCNNSDTCRMHCAAVLWAFGDMTFKSIFQRVKKTHKHLVQADVRDPRLAFIHFMVWDGHSRRPITVDSYQPTSVTKDLVSKALTTRITELPPIISDFCKYRGEKSIPKLEKQIRDMSDQLRHQQLEVFTHDIHTYNLTYM